MPPRITGINHLVLICKDMEESVRFYRDILGLGVKATLSSDRPRYAERTAARGGTAVAQRAPVGVAAGLKRLYFFETADGTMVTLAELPGKDTRADQSLFLPNFWPGEGSPPKNPRKMDHLAFNVESRDDLVAFQKHLRAHGIQVSEIEERSSDPKFVKSIYFYDPNGVPLEIATWDWSDPDWKRVKEENFFQDPDPVPALREKQ